MCDACRAPSPEALQDIAHVFSTFDEAEDATVSSLHLIVALLLCNSRVPVKFKAFAAHDMRACGGGS